MTNMQATYRMMTGWIGAGLWLLTAGLATADLQARYDAAEELRARGDAAASLDPLSELVREAPGSENINFSYGMACLATGDAARAELAFQRVLQLNPANHRARLELARALSASGRHGEARIELERVLAASPPPRVRENVETFLAHVRQQQRTARAYGGQLELGAFYDSNVNTGPEAAIIPISPQSFGFIEIDRLEVDPSSRPRSDVGLYLAGQGNIESGASGPGAWGGEAGAAGYAGLMRDEHDYRLLYYQLHAGLLRRDGERRLRIPVRYAHIYRGGERLMQSTGLAASYSLPVSPAGDRRLTLHADAQWRDYAGRGDRDGFYTYGGLALDHYIGPRRHLAGMGITGYRDFADAAIYAKTGLRWTLHGTFFLPGRSALYGRLNYAVESYREREPLAPADRRDNQMQAAAGFRTRLNPRALLDIQHQMTRSNSTFDLYEYRRSVTTVSTSYAF